MKITGWHRTVLLLLLLAMGAIYHVDGKEAVDTINELINLGVNLSPDQIVEFKKFKSKVAGIVKSSKFMSKDAVLAKFFKASLFNSDLAEMAIKTTMDLRKQLKLDENIPLGEVEELIEKVGGNVLEKDKAGNPIYYRLTGKWGVKNALDNNNTVKWKRAMYLLQEVAAGNALEQLALGKIPTAKFDVFEDYKGWTPEQGACVACLPEILDVAIGGELLYPDFKKQILAVNNPTVDKLLKSVKPLLSKELRETFAIFGDEKEWWGKLTQQVDLDVLQRLFKPPK